MERVLIRRKKIINVKCSFISFSALGFYGIFVTHTHTHLQFFRHPHILTIKTAINVGKFDGEMVFLKLLN